MLHNRGNLFDVFHHYCSWESFVQKFVFFFSLGHFCTDHSTFLKSRGSLGEGMWPPAEGQLNNYVHQTSIHYSAILDQLTGVDFIVRRMAASNAITLFRVMHLLINLRYLTLVAGISQSQSKKNPPFFCFLFQISILNFRHKRKRIE